MLDRLPVRMPESPFDLRRKVWFGVRTTPLADCSCNNSNSLSIGVSFRLTPPSLHPSGLSAPMVMQPSVSSVVPTRSAVPRLRLPHFALRPCHDLLFHHDQKPKPTQIRTEMITARASRRLARRQHNQNQSRQREACNSCQPFALGGN